MVLIKKERETQKRLLVDGSECANDEIQKRRKMGQEVTKKRYYSGSRQSGRQTKYLNPAICSVKGFAQKAKFTTTVTRKKPLEHMKLKNSKPTASQSNERSFGLNDGCGQKPKVTTTVVSPEKPLKVEDSNHSEVKLELVDNKPCLGSRPADTVSLCDSTRSKDGYGQNSKSTTTFISRKKPLMNADDARSVHRKSSSSGKQNLVEINRRPESFEPKELGRNRTFFGSRPEGKVKYWDPTYPEEDDDFKKPEENATKEKAQREKIKDAMAMFEEVYEKLCNDNKKRPCLQKIIPHQLTLEAAKKVKEKLKWIDPEKKTLGSVCGVEVGDRFKFRSQLQMVGLHCQPQHGIDYMKTIKGKNLAISVVDSHRYSNASGYSDKLIYCGHGGTGLYGPKSPNEDQKLEKGNLALKNSKDERSPVRVIRKVEGVGRQEYVYDGLYMVKDYEKARSKEGKLVFKFELHRVPGQPSLHEMFNGNWRHH